MAGMSFRWARSPEAPKMTMAQGEAVGMMNPYARIRVEIRPGGEKLKRGGGDFPLISDE
jgi:hypothetical protein